MAAGRDPSAISIGPGTLYTAPIGTTEPLSLSSFPLAGPWVDLGYTESGTTFTTSYTAQAVMVDEEYTRISTTITDKTGVVAFALAQITAANLKLAYTGGTITTNVGDVQFEPPAAGTETRIMLAWFKATLDEAYLWRQCFQDGSVATNLKKSTPQQLLPVTFTLEKPIGKQSFKQFLASSRSGV